MARSTSSPVTVPGTAVNAVPGRSLARYLLISLRPGQWSKNLVIFAGLLFGRKLFEAAAVIDVLTIAIGFVLRAVAGAVAVNVVISHWLLVCTILLALFIALAKRRDEIVLLAGDASTHRPILGEYSAYLLDQMIGVVTAST